MCYSTEPRDEIYVKGYGFLSFAKSMSKKYSQKLLNSGKKSTTDAIKVVSKRGIQKLPEVASDLIGHNITDKISVSKELHSKKSSQNNLDKVNNEHTKERYISPEKDSKLLMN